MVVRAVRAVATRAEADSTLTLVRLSVADKVRKSGPKQVERRVTADLLGRKGARGVRYTLVVTRRGARSGRPRCYQERGLRAYAYTSGCIERTRGASLVFEIAAIVAPSRK